MTGIFDRITAKEDRPDASKPTVSPIEQNSEPSPKDEMSGRYTPAAIKSAVQEILRYGVIEASRKPAIYKTAQVHQKKIKEILEPIELWLELDEIRGIALLKVASQLFDHEDEWSHPLVRRQRFTLEQSLLVAILRQSFIAHEEDAGIGAEGASLHIDELLPRLQDFLGDLGNDAKEEKRLRNLLEKLKVHGIVSEIDNKNRVTIKPLIAHLANPESLTALLHQFKKLSRKNQTSHTHGDQDGN